MSGEITRRGWIAGTAATGPWIVGCRGKAGPTPQPQPTPTPAHAAIVQRIDSVSAIDGAGATVQRIFPTPQLRHLDPFVLLDDFNVREPAGFPEHPHRGFEAFTYMTHGAFHHRDTMGNDSTIAAGGIQRFNSGRYARHSEMPATRGQNRGLQLWVNLPRAKKQMDPEYQGVDAERMPVAESDGVRIATVVGADSPAALHTDVDYRDVTLLSGRAFEWTVPEGRNTLLYVLADAVQLRDERVAQGQAVVLGPGPLAVRGSGGARFALLSGRPHNEPIVHRGPFVD